MFEGYLKGKLTRQLIILYELFFFFLPEPIEFKQDRGYAISFANTYF